MEANRGNLWTPTAGDGTPAVLGVPNLLAIPNMLVDLLRNQGSAITPHDVLATIDEFIQDNGEPGQQWEYVRKWCLVAGQANANGKSKVWLDTTPVTVDDEDFDRWVGTRLDIAFGPRPPTAAGPSAGVTSIQPAMDFLKFSQMLSTTIGTNMLQFSQAVNPTGGAAGATGSETTLATGKGFDQDQIAKLKDACGVLDAQQIPAIWSVIQATKGKEVTPAVVPVTPYRPRQIYIPRRKILRRSCGPAVQSRGACRAVPFCGAGDDDVGVSLADCNGSRILSGIRGGS